MKKLVCIILAAMLLLAGCASGGETQPPTSPTYEGSMEDLIGQMYENHKEFEMPMMTMAVEPSDTENISFNMGLDNGEKLSDAAISEPMMGQPYSLVLVRVKNPADAVPVAKEMLEKIDTRKWICQMADTKTAAVCGDIVMFVMVNSEFADTVTTQSITEAFSAAVGGTVNTVG